MSILIITPDEFAPCSFDGCFVLHQSGSPRDVFNVLRQIRSTGVLLVGVIRPDPTEWICRLWEFDRAVPVAVIASAGEVPALQKASLNDSQRFMDRIRTLLRLAPPEPVSKYRNLVIDMRAREISQNGRRMVCSP